MCNSPWRAAEFFAGMGLVRKALEKSGFEVVFANDISPVKHKMYASNFGADDFRLGDIRDIDGSDVPDVELVTASFPCTDLSLAGTRAGLQGPESGLFWEFARVLCEMGERRPDAVLLENVLGFATSRGGRDLDAAIEKMNDLGYSCDLLLGDARWFVPQSRPRLFVVGLKQTPDSQDWAPSAFRPEWLGDFRLNHYARRWHSYSVSMPTGEPGGLAEVVEGLPGTDSRWWDSGRVRKFKDSLSAVQRQRVKSMVDQQRISWRTAYRRTRQGRPVWEVRSDDIAGCLRTARGGSSKQALVEAGSGDLRVRWLTPREYARLQGADDVKLDAVTPNQALYGLGDAVCVPVVEWIAAAYLSPVLSQVPRRVGAYA
ncbi:DNA (cytosine-5-)-methyltransferase [Candidatus Poribacteria bacterium]|nr:DNA (cytosine-5-)-methyltransferase [Candidatus Poribacteria bacterium]